MIKILCRKTWYSWPNPMKIRLLASAFAIAVLSTASARADEAGKTAKVEELFKLTRMDETIRRGMALVANQAKSGVLNQLTGIKPSAEMQKELDSFVDKMTAVITEWMSWENLKPAYTQAYAEAYTEAELDDIIAFYKSPGGQAMVNKSMLLMSKSSEIAQKQMMGAQAEIQALMKEAMAKVTAAEPKK